MDDCPVPIACAFPDYAKLEVPFILSRVSTRTCASTGVCNAVNGWLVLATWEKVDREGVFMCYILSTLIDTSRRAALGSSPRAVR